MFKYIQRNEPQDLQRHLVETEGRFDVTEIYDRSGYSPLHFAAYKNSSKIAVILCDFVRPKSVNLSGPRALQGRHREGGGTQAVGYSQGLGQHSQQGRGRIHSLALRIIPWKHRADQNTHGARSVHLGEEQAGH